ncbi:MAG: hypothetical protein E4G74_04375 [Erysipelotrichales bacterium]|nr:MAG: hypothetical protein E4G74_04375 [Erysipelotrichales bacterium]
MQLILELMSGFTHELQKLVGDKLQYFVSLETRKLTSHCLVHQIGGLETRTISIRTRFAGIRPKVYLLDECSMFEDFMTFSVRDAKQLEMIESFCKETRQILYNEIAESESKIVQSRDEARKNHKYLEIVRQQCKETEGQKMNAEHDFRMAIQKMLKAGYAMEDMQEQMANITMEDVHGS